MEFISESKISNQQSNSLNKKMNLKPSQRIEEGIYKTQFNSLKDLLTKRSLRILSPELKSDYINLLGK